MNDNPNDGWPEKYRDPRDRPHPDVVRVTVETGDEMRDGVLDATDAVADGESRPAVVSFATVDQLRKILTDRRVELLQALTDTDGAAESISALAETLGRDYRPVHDDVTRLADYGLVFIIEDGGSNRPYLPYERVHLDVELVGGDHSEDPAPA